MMKEEIEIPQGQRIVSTLVTLRNKQGDSLFYSKDTWKASLRMDQNQIYALFWVLFCFCGAGD